MSYTAKTVYGGTSPIDENRHVNDLMDIFKKNGLNDEAKGLAEVVGRVASMERDLNKAISELTAVRRELSELRDGQKSPVKSMLGKAVDGVLSRLRAIRQKVQVLKEKIIGACEQTVEAVKDKGISAANDIAAALDIKGDLEAARDEIHATIASCEKQIANVEAAAKEFHTAGMHFRNIGRIIMGKEPINEVKPNGKLARFMAAPFRSEINLQKRCLDRTNKSIGRLDKLEKAAGLRAEKGRPSVHGDMKRIKNEISQAKADISNVQRTKTAGHSL